MLRELLINDNFQLKKQSLKCKKREKHLPNCWPTPWVLIFLHVNVQREIQFSMNNLHPKEKLQNYYCRKLHDICTTSYDIYSASHDQPHSDHLPPHLSYMSYNN